MNKQIFKIAIVVIALVMGGLSAYAQEKGEMAAGGNVGIATGNDVTSFGVGAKFQYTLPQVYGIGKIRPELGGTLYFGDEKSFDISLNGHYLIPIPKVDKLTVYPLIGLSLVGTDIGSAIENDSDPIWGDDAVVEDAGGTSYQTKIGFNIGAGVEYAITKNISAQLELKYRIRSAEKIEYDSDYSWSDYPGTGVGGGNYNNAFSDKINMNKFIIQVGVTYKF